MPELPEVETVVRDLRPHIVGRAITGVRTSRKKLRRPWQPAWSKSVQGASIQSVRRRGKWILVELNRGAILIHLGMTGQLTTHSHDEPVKDHTHITLDLNDGRELRYCDIRRFGSVEWFDTLDAMMAVVEDKLGPEPFDITPQQFQDNVRSSDRAIKAILLDQAAIAGVGNIYADESLFRAGIHPETPGAKLKPARCERLREAIVLILTNAIEHRGSTIRNYVGGSGLMGGYQGEFAAYGRTDEPCVTCQRAIVCIRVAGRSTHFCTKCQKQ